MNRLEIYRFKTANGNFFVYEVDTLAGTSNPIITGEGYYVDQEGNLVQSVGKNGKKRSPRRDSAMKERYWASETFGENFKEEVIKGPLAEKLSNLFDSRIPRQRTFGAPKEKEGHFAGLAALKEKMGK